VKESNTYQKPFWITSDIELILEETKNKEKLANRSDALRTLVRAGNIFKKSIEGIKNNPQALEQALVQLDDIRREEKLAVWFESMTLQQRNAIVDIIQLINEGKWQQTNLVSYETKPISI